MSPRAPKNDPEKKPAASRKTAATKTTATRRRTVKAAPPLVTSDDIAYRAYMISISGEGGDEVANWLRAEHELTGSQLAA
jgi:hypothetical protein